MRPLTGFPWNALEALLPSIRTVTPKFPFYGPDIFLHRKHEPYKEEDNDSPNDKNKQTTKRHNSSSNA